MTDLTSRFGAALRRRAQSYSFAGVATGWAFFALSLTPSLLPRSALFQGILCGITGAFGYGIGVGVAKLWQYLGLPAPPPERRPTIRRVVVALIGVLSLVLIFQVSTWQNNIRDIMGMDPVSRPWFALLAILIGIAVAIAVVGLSRLVAKPVQALVRLSGRRMPPRVARVVGVTLGVLLLVLLTRGLLVDPVIAGISSALSVQDGTTDPGVEQPSTPLRSGSPESLVAWDTLGRQGRKWVAEGPTAEDIDAFSGGGATEPIRVYVGLKSADTLEERADLALQELIRTDAFEREVLVIATSTGSGGIEARGTTPVEYLFNGDTAMVGLQYSYLPSSLSLFVDSEAAKETSRAFLEAIHEHWKDLDPDERPRLYLFGLSLGSFGSESSARSIRLIADPIDGAVWTGPTFLNEDWVALTANRDEDSPAWLPVYDDGSVVRFSGREPAFEEPTGEWADRRFVYLQHPSDPVTFFSFDLLTSRPGWLQGERSPEMSPDIRWLPGVTFWQVAADLPAGTAVPQGFGHNYSAQTYVAAWAAVAQPQGWTESDRQRLAELVTDL